MLKKGGAASMVWILSGIDSAGGLYKDYDHYTTYRGDETANLLAAYASQFRNDAPACRVAARAPSGSTSPYVRVRKQREQVAVVSSGWAFSDG
jgi:hypothetical protein